MDTEPETIADLRTCPTCHGDRMIIVGVMGPRTPEPCPCCKGSGYVSTGDEPTDPEPQPEA